jgi:hypothetical protein
MTKGATCNLIWSVGLSLNELCEKHRFTLYMSGVEERSLVRDSSPSFPLSCDHDLSIDNLRYDMNDLVSLPSQTTFRAQTPLVELEMLP